MLDKMLRQSVKSLPNLALQSSLRRTRSASSSDTRGSRD